MFQWGDKTITIGTQTYTETKILANMYKELIESETDLTVEIKEDLATSHVLIDALAKGDLYMGTIFIGTIANIVEIENPQDSEATWEQARDLFAGDEYNLSLLSPLEYANTYAFTFRDDIAEEYNLEKVSDLDSISEQYGLNVNMTDIHPL